LFGSLDKRHFLSNPMAVPQGVKHLQPLGFGFDMTISDAIYRRINQDLVVHVDGQPAYVY
jgi:hypothetical protein